MPRPQNVEVVGRNKNNWTSLSVKNPLINYVGGTGEAIFSALTGLGAWPASKFAGLASMMAGQVEIPDVSPGANQGFGLTPGSITGTKAQMVMDRVHDTENIVSSALTYPPTTEFGKQGAERIGQVIDIPLTAAKTVANVEGDLYKKVGLKNITEVDPRLGWAAGLATEFMAFKGVHGVSKGLKTKINNFAKKTAKQKWKLETNDAAVEAGNLLDDFREEMGIKADMKSFKDNKLRDLPVEQQEAIKAHARELEAAAQQKVTEGHQLWQAEVGVKPDSRPDAVGRFGKTSNTKSVSPIKLKDFVTQQPTQTIPTLSAADLLSSDKYNYLSRKKKPFTQFVPEQPEVPQMVETIASKGAAENRINTPLTDKNNQTTKTFIVNKQNKDKTITTKSEKTKVPDETELERLARIKNQMKSFGSMIDSGIGPRPRKVEVVKREVTPNANPENTQRMVPVEQQKQEVKGTSGRENDPTKVSTNQGEPEVQRLDEATSQETQQKPSVEVVERKPNQISDTKRFLDEQINKLEKRAAGLDKIPKKNLTDEQRYIKTALEDFKELEKNLGKLEEKVTERTPDSIGKIKTEPKKLLSLDEGVTQARAKIPEVMDWLSNPKESKVDIGKVKDELNELANSFDPYNPNHSEQLLDPIERALVEISKKEREISKPKKNEFKVSEADIDELIRLSEDEGWVEPEPTPSMQNTPKETTQPSRGLTPEETMNILQDEVIKYKQEKQAKRLDELQGKTEPKKKLTKAQKRLQAQKARDEMFQEFDTSRTEPIEYDSELAEYGVRDMADDFRTMFGDERGSFSTRDLSPERMAALQRVMKKLKQEGKDISSYLRSVGLTEDIIRGTTQAAKVVEQKGAELKKVYQPYKNSDGELVIKRRPGPRGTWNGKKLFKPEVTAKEFNAIAKAQELEYKAFGDLAKWIENPIRAFERAGKEIKEIIYYDYRDRLKQTTLDRNDIHNDVKNLRKGISYKEAKKLGVYMHSLQERGIESLEASGIKNIEKIISEVENNPKLMQAAEELRVRFDNLLKKTNDARAAIGINPIRRIDNYLTFMRTQSMLEKMGIKSNPIFEGSTFLHNKFKQFGQVPVTFAKLRSKTGAMPIEIDPFYLYERYANSAAEHINMSPLVAKIKELQRGFKDPETGKTWVLRQHKPQLADFLRQWSNHIAGVEEHKLPPTVRRVLGELQGNLLWSLLSFNIRSAAIQPYALKGTFTEIGTKYTIKGIQSLFSPKSRAHAMYKSKVLDARSMDVGISEAHRRIRSGRYGDIRALVAELGMKPMKWLDMETAKATWNGAYQFADEVLRIRDENARINYADDVVTKTQASGFKGDRAPIQRTAMTRALSFLQTFTINEWGYLTKDVLGFGDQKLTTPARLAKIWRYTFASILLTSLYEDVLGIKSPGPTPIRAIQKGVENDDNFLSIMADVGGELIEPIPLIGNTRYGSNVLGGVVGLLGDISELAGGDVDVGSTAGIETISKSAGIPGAGQLMKSYRRVQRGGEVQGLLPQALPEEAGELYSVIMGQYDETKKRRKKRKKLGY